MDRIEILALLRRHKLAVIASVSESGAPQAAIVGVAISDQLELVLDTLTSTRKFQNVMRDGRVALVLGEGELTIQIEGRADVPDGDDLRRLHEVYFATYPDGRERIAWPDITWLRVRAQWIRVADYAQSPPAITEHYV